MPNSVQSIVALAFLSMPSISGYSLGGMKSRREFGSNFLKTTASTFGSSTAFLGNPSLVSAAMPMVTVEEFEGILKESYKSVGVVEFGGIKGESAIVKLVDGTEFGISDLVESSTDPRSPLKLVASCKGYGVPTKFTYINSVLGAAPKRKKVYMNERLAEAAKKEEAKRLRIEEDEQARLKAVYEMEADI